MKKILSLCINLLLLIISDAVPLKLIAGDRSVVKKDGATHTISKYYIVPNDFDSNNVTDSTKASQTALSMNHSLYSKSMNTDTASEDQLSENRGDAANDKNNDDVINTEVNLRSGLNDEVDVATQADNNTNESTGSVNTDQSLDPDDLGNLQVEPITSSININSNVTIDEINEYNSSESLQNGTSLSVEKSNKTEKQIEDELADSILTKFGVAVHERSVENIESFWKLMKLNIDTISDIDEFLAEIERLYLLLNIFTNLYEAAQLKKPIESMIDSIIDILQIPFVEKSNTSESQSQTDVSGDYDEECLRKCGLKRSKPQLDSNGTYLSETESLEVSDNLELEKLNLQRRQRGDSDDDWVITSNDPVSNQIIASNQPTNIQRSQLLVPNNLKVGVADGSNVHSSIPMPPLNYVTRNNDIQEDPAETDENKDYQPLAIDPRLTDDWPWTIEDQSTQNIPWTIQTETTEDLPWYIENKTIDNLPWHIEDKTINYQPWTIKHRTTHTLPWTIEEKATKKVPWKVENNADPNWTIENKKGHSPIILYQSGDPSVITQGGKILLHANQPMTGTVHSVKKPYRIYTYVIHPATSLDEIPNSGNIVKVKSRQPNGKLETKLYGLSTSYGGNKVVYNNKPSSSYYESQFSLSKPSVDISLSSISQLNHTNYVTYDTSNEVNPSNVISETPQDDNQPQYLAEHEPETNHKPALLQPNTLPLDSQTNSDPKNEKSQVPEAGSQPEVLLPKVPSNPVELLINRGNTRPVSTANASASADTSDFNPDIGDTEPNPNSPDINLNLIQQTNLHPGVISKALSHSEYTNLPDDYDEPSPVNAEHPDLISSPSFSSEYTNLPDENDEPVHGGQTYQHPDLISSSASSNSENTNLPDEYDDLVYGAQTHQHLGLISSSSLAYTNVVNDYDEPIPFYGGQTHKYPSFISKAPAHSEYTNLPNKYNNPIPDYGQNTDRHSGLISKIHHYPEFAKAVDDPLPDYDEPIPVYDGQTHKRPGFISDASSHSEFTNLPDEYVEPVHGGQTYQHPDLISSSASSNSENTNLPDEYDDLVYGAQTHQHLGLISSSSLAYTNVVNDYDEPIPFYGGQTHKYPSFISKAPAHSEYTNLPNKYNNPIPDYGQNTDRHSGLISKIHHYPEFAKAVDEPLPDYDEPIPVYDGQTHKRPGFISDASSHSEFTNLPDEYVEPVHGGQTYQHPDLISSSASSNSENTNLPDEYDDPVYGAQTHQHPGLISSSSLAYANAVEEYDEPIPFYGGQTHKYPDVISEASSHSEFTNVPNDFINPTLVYEEDLERYPVHIQTTVNGGPIENEENLLVSDHPYGHAAHIVQPSLIAHVHGNQPTGPNYLEHLKLKLTPTYRLFTLDNLLRLHDVVIKTIEVNGDEFDVYDNRALKNLSKIINVILTLAKHLEEPESSTEWYEKIFYNTQKNRNQLEIYVYNLIRQRWLHELLLVLYKNDFNFNILQNPGVFSFLESWQFPNYVLNLKESEELIQHKFDVPEVFDVTLSSQHSLQDKFTTHTYDDMSEDVPENLENYVTKNVIDSYKSPNAGIVLSIAGVEAEPDANAIMHILQKYLHYKSFIEKQENVIIRDNKIEMLNQIILFLTEKGYAADTIADLINKLHTAVYSTDGKGCQIHDTDFAKNMYDVILPVLRRSER